MILNNKVVVVTGGAGLIGQGFVEAIIEHGGIAIVADVNEKAGNEVVERLKAANPQAAAEFVEVDITAKDSLAELISTLHSKYGRIDSLVNNAYPRNQNYGRRFEDVTYDDFCQNVSIHLGGYFLTSQLFVEYFKAQGRGSIVNMSSIYGVVAPRFQVYEGTPMTMPVEYAAVKSAIIHLTKYLAQYLKGSNIRVNCISPGGILAGQPAEFLSRYSSYASTKGMLDANDLLGTLVFLLSDMSRYINGQNIVVDDGWTL